MTVLDAVIAGDADLVEDLLRSVSDNTLNQIYKGSDGKSYTVLDKARELSGTKGKKILALLGARDAKSAKRMSRKTKSKGGSSGGKRSSNPATRRNRR